MDAKAPGAGIGRHCIACDVPHVIGIDGDGVAARISAVPTAAGRGQTVSGRACGGVVADAGDGGDDAVGAGDGDIRGADRSRINATAASVGIDDAETVTDTAGAGDIGRGDGINGRRGGVEREIQRRAVGAGIARRIGLTGDEALGTVAGQGDAGARANAPVGATVGAVCPDRSRFQAADIDLTVGGQCVAAA